MIRMIDQHNHALPTAPVVIHIEPIITDAMIALDFMDRGNSEIQYETYWTADRTEKAERTDYRPSITPRPTHLKGKEESYPEALTKLQYYDAINSNPDMTASASGEIRECYVSVKLNKDGTINLHSNIDNRFPLENIKPPFRLKSGQVIKGKGKTFTTNDGETIECLQVDNDHYKINNDETSQFHRSVYFNYYELDDNRPPPINNILCEAEEIAQQTEREQADIYIKDRITDLFTLPPEYDISQQDEYIKHDITDKRDAFIYASEEYQPVPGGVLQKTENIGRHPQDQDIYDVRFFMTQLGLNEDNARLVKDWTRNVIGFDPKLTKHWIEKYKLDLKIGTRESFQEIKRLSDSLEELSDSYQDNNSLDLDPTADMQNAIENLKDLDNREMRNLMETARRHGIDAQVKEIILDQFTPPTPDRRDERPHNINLTMKPETDDLPERFAGIKTLDPRTDNFGNWIADILDYQFIDSENWRLYDYDDERIQSHGNFDKWHRIDDPKVKPTSDELKEIIRIEKGIPKIHEMGLTKTEVSEIDETDNPTPTHEIARIMQKIYGTRPIPKAETERLKRNAGNFL